MVPVNPMVPVYSRPPYLKAERKFKHAEYRWWGTAFAMLLVGGAASFFGGLFGRKDIAEAAWMAAMLTSFLPVIAATRVFRRGLRLIDHAHEIDRRKFEAWLRAEVEARARRDG